MCQVCPRLCGVAGQTFASVPARDPDRLIKWFIGVVVIAAGVNLLTSLVVAQKWAWLPPGRLCCGPISRCVEFWSSWAGAQAQRGLGPRLCSH